MSVFDATSEPRQPNYRLLEILRRLKSFRFRASPQGQDVVDAVREARNGGMFAQPTEAERREKEICGKYAYLRINIDEFLAEKHTDAERE